MTSGKHRGKLYLVEIKTASGNWKQFEPVTKRVLENKTSSGKHA